MYSKSDLIDKLNNDKIKYQLTEHEALFTVKDSNKKRGSRVVVKTRYWELDARKIVWHLITHFFVIFITN